MSLHGKEEDSWEYWEKEGMEEEEYRKAQEKVESKTKMFFTGGYHRFIMHNKGFYMHQQLY